MQNDSDPGPIAAAAAARSVPSSVLLQFLVPPLTLVCSSTDQMTTPLANVGCRCLTYISDTNLTCPDCVPVAYTAHQSAATEAMAEAPGDSPQLRTTRALSQEKLEQLKSKSKLMDKTALLGGHAPVSRPVVNTAKLSMGCYRSRTRVLG